MGMKFAVFRRFRGVEPEIIGGQD